MSSVAPNRPKKQVLPANQASDAGQSSKKRNLGLGQHGLGPNQKKTKAPKLVVDDNLTDEQRKAREQQVRKERMAAQQLKKWMKDNYAAGQDVPQGLIAEWNKNKNAYLVMRLLRGDDTDVGQHQESQTLMLKGWKTRHVLLCQTPAFRFSKGGYLFDIESRHLAPANIDTSTLAKAWSPFKRFSFTHEDMEMQNCRGIPSVNSPSP
jgi:hypothetical protein